MYVLDMQLKQLHQQLLLSQNPILSSRRVIDIGFNTNSIGLGINHQLDSVLYKRTPYTYLLSLFN